MTHPSGRMLTSFALIVAVTGALTACPTHELEFHAPSAGGPSAAMDAEPMPLVSSLPQPSADPGPAPRERSAPAPVEETPITPMETVGAPARI